MSLALLVKIMIIDICSIYLKWQTDRREILYPPIHSSNTGPLPGPGQTQELGTQSLFPISVTAIQLPGRSSVVS